MAKHTPKIVAPPVVEPAAPVVAETVPETPKYVTIEQLNAMEQSINRMAENFNSGIQTLVNAQRQNQTPSNQPPAEVTEAELDQAAQSGEGVGRVLKRALADLERKIVTQYVDPVRAQGADVIGQLSERVVRSEMPYYDLLKTDVDKMLDNMDPGLRMQPKVLKHVYDTVVGQNINKIVAREVETQLRKTTDGDPTETPTTTRTASPKDPSAEETFGREALDSLKFLKGAPDPDLFAQRLGYKDAKEYLKMALEMENQ